MTCIPTKFVIDKNGQMRFMQIGRDGDAGKIVERVSAMLDLVKRMAPVASAQTGKY